MNFDTWEPVYEAILADLGYDRDGDERARDVLQSHLADRSCFDVDRLGFTGQTVAIVAPGHGLEAEADSVREADAVVAASTAADRLHDRGIPVDCLVTDLDGNPETARALTHAEVPVAVHAHGDNRDALEAFVPEMDPGYVVPTTQARPTDVVRNFGGFTDGDRAAFLADALGAGRLVFPGWNLGDETVSAEKQQKLAWATRLLTWLERRRGERFSALDGHRDTFDLRVVDGVCEWE